MLSLFVPFVCLFLGRMRKDQKSIQDRIGLMYQSVGVPTYVGILIAVGVCKYSGNDRYHELVRRSAYQCRNIDSCRSM